MKTEEINGYTPPGVETTLIEVESGFAATSGVSIDDAFDGTDTVNFDGM